MSRKQNSENSQSQWSLGSIYVRSFGITLRTFKKGIEEKKMLSSEAEIKARNQQQVFDVENLEVARALKNLEVQFLSMLTRQDYHIIKELDAKTTTKA